MSLYNCCCGATACNTIRVTPRKCSGALYVGTVITVKLGTTVIGTCTASAGSTCDFAVADGTYTVTGVAPNGVTITGSVTVSGCVLTNTTLQFIDVLTARANKLCGASADTVTVTFTGSTSGTLGTCALTVGASVSCSITPTVDLTGQTITVSFTWKGRSYSASWIPGVSNSCASPVVELTEHLCAQVNACDPTDPTAPPSPRPGASVTFTLIGTGVVGSGTTDGTGVCCIDSSSALANGDVIQVDASYPSSASGTTTFTIGDLCPNPPPPLATCDWPCVIIDLTAAPGFACFCCDEPIPTTLTGSDGLGSFTLIYDAVNFWWAGCALRTAANVAPLGCVGGLSTNVQVPVWMVLDQTCHLGVGLYPCNVFGTFFPEDGHTCGDAVPGYLAGTPTITCPPSFSASRTFTTGAMGADVLAQIYGGSTAVTLTVTP